MRARRVRVRGRGMATLEVDAVQAMLDGEARGEGERERGGGVGRGSRRDLGRTRAGVEGTVRGSRGAQRVTGGLPCALEGRRVLERGDGTGRETAAGGHTPRRRDLGDEGVRVARGPGLGGAQRAVESGRRAAHVRLDELDEGTRRATTRLGSPRIGGERGELRRALSAPVSLGAKQPRAQRRRQSCKGCDYTRAQREREREGLSTAAGGRKERFQSRRSSTASSDLHSSRLIDSMASLQDDERQGQALLEGEGAQQMGERERERGTHEQSWRT